MLATRTLQAIEQALEADEGARYRGLLAEAFKEIGDAFDPTYDPTPRKHLGGSLIGRKCARELWYGFRWFHREVHSAKTLRLFNRGHLEEARFIALLRLIPGAVSWHSENGKQFRVAGCLGHFGSAIDGVMFGCPDYPGRIIVEFKTHGSKSFAKLAKEGVRKAKPEHVVQMQIYMGYYSLPAALYCACNKDTDELHFEIVEFDRAVYEQYMERAHKIIHATTPPPRIADSPAWFDCKFCSKIGICHLDHPVAINCRTCRWSAPSEGASWKCTRHNKTLEPANQLAGCPDHLLI